MHDFAAENEGLKHRICELEQELQRHAAGTHHEHIRAKAAANVLSTNSAIQKLVAKKTEELRERQAELDSIGKMLEVAQCELYQAQKMESLGRLSAGLAHEINTPIQFVSDSLFFLEQGLTDLLDLVERLTETASEAEAGARQEQVGTAREELDYEYLREQLPASLKRAGEGIARVTEIVRSMKSFSHPDRTTMTMADVNEGLRSTLAISKNEYKYVADVVTRYGEIPKIRCLAGELNQAFLNIVVNAAHAITEAQSSDNIRGTITVETRTQDENVVIEISDTGTGIPTEVQARIFDDFFTTKPVGKGTGQGLSLAKKVIQKMHGGTICFRTRQGQGTTFTITLPIAQTSTTDERLRSAA
ncbi:MAG: histidine kinase [Armatimonadetes bacterium]|nr:histidine kinase [Armatimonadota bacterium]